MRNAIRRITTAVRALLPARFGAFDATVWGAAAVALLAGFAVLVWLVKGPTLIVNNGRRASLEAARGPLSGLPCPDPIRRPIAVMLASDPEARPLSGIRSADMVIEAPVTPDGITRMMAVFQCSEPEEIGSVRSARATFLPYVLGLDAVYAHWGGERDVLAALDAGVADNIDALRYEGTVYFRKRDVPRPHNGFTTLDALEEQAVELGYRATASIDPYPHGSQPQGSRNLGTAADVVVLSGPLGMDVEFRYESAAGTYRRWRGGEPELDRLDGLQIAPAVVVVMDVGVERTYDQYLDLASVGEGTATVYQQGRVSSARWQKLSASAMLRFVDARGAPVLFAPGQLWIAIRVIR
jgi:hypothetical protein